MDQKLQKSFASAKTPSKNNELAVYMLQFKQTPAQQPAYQALLAEQTGYAKEIEALQKKNGRSFPHLVLPAEGVLAPALVVCTKEVADKLRSLPSITVVVPRPEIPLSNFKKKVERTIGISPA